MRYSITAHCRLLAVSRLRNADHSNRVRPATSNQVRSMRMNMAGAGFAKLICKIVVSPPIIEYESVAVIECNINFYFAKTTDVLYTIL